MTIKKIMPLAMLTAMSVAITACQPMQSIQPTHPKGQNVQPQLPTTPVKKSGLAQELVKHKWKLYDAVDSSNHPIGSLMDIKQQVKLSFSHTPDGDSIGFSVGCNGHGANYHLHEDGTFVTEFIMATRMYCEQLDKAERTLVGFMSDSSQLSLLERHPLLLKQVTKEGVVLTWEAVQ